MRLVMVFVLPERINCEAHAGDRYYAYNRGPRHDWMLTLNPLSAGMQKTRLQLELPASDRQKKFPLRHYWSMSECVSYFNRVDIAFENRNVDSQNPESDTDEDEAAISRLKTCWSRRAWKEYHPLGIPPLVASTTEYHD